MSTSSVMVIGWLGLTGYVVYELFQRGHPVWAVVIAVVMGGMLTVNEKSETTTEEK